MSELDYRWRSVKDHGQPTKESCPWGYRIRWENRGSRRQAARTILASHDEDTEWQPLPPPCDKVMPSPEPDVAEKIADYVQTHRGYWSMTPRQTAVEAVRVVIGDEAALRDVIAAARPDWMGVLDAVEAGETVGPAAHQQGGAMTHRTVTIPPVTAALLAHEVTDWSTHDYRGSVEVGDRGIIVAGAGKVTSEDVPEGWFYDGEMGVDSVSPLDGRSEIPVHSRAAVAVGTVADVVPIVADYDNVASAYSGPAAIEITDGMLWAWPKWDSAVDDDDIVDLSHLLPFSDWSPTTDTGKQRWAVRWEDMRVLEEAVTEYPCLRLDCDIYCECGAEGRLLVPLHRGWREADPGLIAACGESNDT